MTRISKIEVKPKKKSQEVGLKVEIVYTVHLLGRCFHVEKWLMP